MTVLGAVLRNVLWTSGPRKRLGRPSTAFTIAALAFLTGCGGGGGSKGVTNPNPTPKRTMSARIDGAAWTATNIAAGNTNGTLIIAGARGTDQGVAIGASLLQGIGTQTIDRTSAVVGTVSIASAQWSANGFQGSGTVTLTFVSATRVAGTFSFTAPAVSAATFPATKVVASGSST